MEPSVSSETVSSPSVSSRAASPPTALITGASRGLGRALADGLAAHGWRLLIDARRGDDLHRAAGQLRAHGQVTAIAGDITDPRHRARLAEVAEPGLDAVVLNAGALGPSPLPALADLGLDDLRDLLEVNVVAQLAVVQDMLPRLRPDATLVLVTSDAAREAWPGWGAYGLSKAALEQLGAVLAVEHPDLRVLVVDPGDLRTDMHQAAFPDEDISDRPLPGTVVPSLVALLHGDQPSGRYRAAEIRSTVSA